MPRGSSRWLRMLGKELAYQKRQHPRRIQSAVLACIAVSGLSAATLWRGSWSGINADIDQQLRTNLGLIDLRVNQHKTTVLDWGHWDSLYAFSQGRYPQFINRELAPSSVISDQQGMVILDRAGRLLAAMPAGQLNDGLMACLEQRLARLRQLSPQAPDDTAFGFFCRIGDRSLIGAGTGIRPSRERRPEGGWVLHLSAMERPSFNSDLNQAFRAMSQSIELRRDLGQTFRSERSATISELLQPGDHFVLRSSKSPWQSIRLAGEAMLPPWLGINALLIGMLGLGLTTARQRRLPGRLREIKEQRSARSLRRRLGSLLMNRRQLLLAFEEKHATQPGDWLVALRLWTPPRLSARPGLEALQQKQLHQLAVALNDALQPQLMGLMDGWTIALALASRGAEHEDEGMRQRLNALLDECRASPSGGGELLVSATLGRITESETGQQLISLCDLLASCGPDQTLVLQPTASAEALETLRGSVHSDSTERWLRDLEDGCTALSPVWLSAPEGPRIAFQEMRFRPSPATMPPQLAAQGNLISNPGSALLVDAYMLRQALQWLSHSHTHDSCAIRIHGSTWCSDHPFQALIDQLEDAPAAQRQRLIMALTEASLSRRVELCQRRCQRLQQLGVRICVDEFGDGVVPVQDVFALQPSLLRLSADLAARLNDPNSDTMVEFLVAYCRYQGCLLIMQGIETEASRRHWTRLGVEALHGAAAAPQPSEQRSGTASRSGHGSF